MNTLILRDPMVSEHHAVLWQDRGGVWLRDLGSSNGTRVNGEQPEGSVRLKVGDLLVFGSTEVEVIEHEAEPAPEILVLEELGAGFCVPLVKDRIRVGRTPECDLITASGPDHVLTLFVARDSLWAGTDEGEAEVEVGQPFDAGGYRFVVRPCREAENQTVVPNPSEPPLYDLEVTLDGPTGVSAVFSDPTSERTHHVVSENRVVLLYQLAQAVREAREATESREQGWCEDPALCQGVWGRTYRPNQLHVLIHRLRAELRKGGFDPWFIEKRRGFTRLRLRAVHVR